MIGLQQQAVQPTVGDTIWVTRTVTLPAGRTVRAADWDVADPVELLGAAKVALRGGSADISYPVAVWRAGAHTLQVPGPLLLSPDGTVDSLPTEPLTLRVASVLPRAAADTSLHPQPRAEFVPRGVTSPIPLLVLLIGACLLLAPLHWWWRRRGRPHSQRTSPRQTGPAKPSLERWADAGESRAVAAAATVRLRATVAARLASAVPALDTDEVLARITTERPDWPVAELGAVLHALDAARFGNGPAPDAIALARDAAELEARLTQAAA